MIVSTIQCSLTIDWISESKAEQGIVRTLNAMIKSKATRLLR
jgi:hypothetical protein